MNGELAVHLGFSIDAALGSFVTGWTVLTVGLLARPSARAGLRALLAAVRDGRIPAWQCFGGVVGGLTVFTQGYAVPLAGVALTTIGIVGGQTANAVVVDQLGIGPGGRVPASLPRVLAAGLAVVGVVVAVGGEVSGAASGIVVPIVLAVVVGALISVQQGTNGRVGIATGDVLATTWLNFTNGLVLLLVLTLPGRLVGLAGAPLSWSVPWWAWCGGLAGIGVVSISVVAVRHLGVLEVMILMLLGQLGTAVALDAASPETRGHIGPVVVGGLLVTLVAAVLAGVVARRAGAATRRGRMLP